MILEHNGGRKMNEEPKFNTIEFEGAVKQAQVKKGGEVIIQLTAVIDDVDMNKLSAVMDSTGGVNIHLEGNQTELVDDEEENPNQTELLGSKEEANED